MGAELQGGHPISDCSATAGHYHQYVFERQPAFPAKVSLHTSRAGVGSRSSALQVLTAHACCTAQWAGWLLPVAASSQQRAHLDAGVNHCNGLVALGSPDPWGQGEILDDLLTGGQQQDGGQGCPLCGLHVP